MKHLRVLEIFSKNWTTLTWLQSTYTENIVFEDLKHWSWSLVAALVTTIRPSNGLQLTIMLMLYISGSMLVMTLFGILSYLFAVTSTVFRGQQNKNARQSKTMEKLNFAKHLHGLEDCKNLELENHLNVHLKLANHLYGLVDSKNHLHLNLVKHLLHLKFETNSCVDRRTAKASFTSRT